MNLSIHVGAVAGRVYVTQTDDSGTVRLAWNLTPAQGRSLVRDLTRASDLAVAQCVAHRVAPATLSAPKANAREGAPLRDDESKVLDALRRFGMPMSLPRLALHAAISVEDAAHAMLRLVRTGRTVWVGHGADEKAALVEGVE